jgi:hypothetical protein
MYGDTVEHAKRGCYERLKSWLLRTIGLSNAEPRRGLRFPSLPLSSTGNGLSIGQTDLDSRSKVAKFRLSVKNPFREIQSGELVVQGMPERCY